MVVRKRKIISPIATAQSNSNVVTITATLSAPDNSATSTYADLKYNKQAVVNFEWDDNSLGAISAQGIMSTRYFTDGAGNNKPYAGAVGVVGINTFDNSEWGANQSGRVSYTQMKQLVSNGWDIANHSLKHISLADTPTAVTDLTEMNNLIQLHTDYKMNYLIVPEDYAFYVQAADQLGFISASTQGGKDGYDIYWMYANNLTNVTSILPVGYTQFNRDFSDDWGATLTDYKSKIDYLVNNSSSSVHRFWRNGSHNLTNSTAFTQLVDYIQTQANDKVWVCSTREWMEYKFAKQQVVKTQSISGNTVTITLDFSNIGSSIRWQDLSLVLNTTANLTNVTVNGATGSFNPTTKLINIFKQKTVFETTLVNTLYPMDASKAYGGDVTELFDGITNYNAPYEGNGLLVDPREVWYEFENTDGVKVTKLRWFDGNGTFSPGTKFYLIQKGTWVRTLVATYTGDLFGQWVDVPVSANFQARYLVMQGAANTLPSELEVYADYVPYTAPPVVVSRQTKTFNNMTGVNAYPWNLQDVNTFQIIPESATHLNKLKAIRYYLDWHYIENAAGTYSFSPTLDGLWDLDNQFKYAKDNGITLMPCLKTLPTWFLSAYQPGKSEIENIPAPSNSNLEDPESYNKYGDMIFQFVARYGSNTGVNPALVSTAAGNPNWWPGANSKQIGLGYITYIEIENERDKTWKGRDAYQTGREFGAFMKKAYDRAKQADPNIKVVMGGIASANMKYIRGLIDWCKEHNSGVIPFDVNNFHLYSNDGGSQQHAAATRGQAPELSGAEAVVDTYISESQRLLGDKEVWITETGYDINQGSTQKAIAIGSKTLYETQADWSLRTALMLNAKHVDRTFFYEYTDNSTGSNSTFFTSGIVENDYTARPVLNVLKQAIDIIGAYRPVSLTKVSGVWVYEYQLSTAKVYVLLKASENGSSTTYNLPFTSGTSLTVYTVSYNSATPTTQNITTTGTFYTVAVSETPVFVKVN
jgi:hypothetical protein